MAKLNFEEIRRYTTEEYGMADINQAFGFPGKTRIEMQNLEVLSIYGFEYDRENDWYIHRKSGIKISPTLIMEFEDCPRLIHERMKDWENGKNT